MPSESTIEIAVGDVRLPGDLTVPEQASGVVVFAHGSGSSRHSPRNRQVARGLQDAGFGTLLMDLLTEDEERVDVRTAEHRFDIPLLAERLTAAVDRLADHQLPTAGLPVGTFGASTGAAAALICAADRPERVNAVVSRGGRPDLAGQALERVRVPVLLVVGGNDPVVIDLNEQAARSLRRAEVRLVPGATHLFEESGALESVTELTAEWFRRWLAPGETGEAAPGGSR
jgi:pimeloyl-ACP methyl ester carboxylesterase